MPIPFSQEITSYESTFHKTHTFIPEPKQADQSHTVLHPLSLSIPHNCKLISLVSIAMTLARK